MVVSYTNFDQRGIPRGKNPNVNDLQLYIAIGLPTIAVLASLTVSLIQISAIRGDVRAIREDLRETRADTKSEIAAIREDIREIRADIKLLTGKVYEMMSR
jgi:hypothetical protein